MGFTAINKPKPPYEPQHLAQKPPPALPTPPPTPKASSNHDAEPNASINTHPTEPTTTTTTPDPTNPTLPTTTPPTTKWYRSVILECATSAGEKLITTKHTHSTIHKPHPLPTHTCATWDEYLQQMLARRMARPLRRAVRARLLAYYREKYLRHRKGGVADL